MRRRARRVVAPCIAALASVAAGCKVHAVDGNAIGPQREPVGGPGRAADGLAAKTGLTFAPLGHAIDGASRAGTAAGDRSRDAVPMPDRWRIGFPSWERGSQSDSPYDAGAPFDPYHQNFWKGDYPIPGTQNTFVNVEFQSVTRYESKKLPTASGVFTRDFDSTEFFGNGHQTLAEETLFLTLDVFQGETAFKPVDWRVVVRGAVDGNRATAEENTVLYADPMRGDTRTDRHAALQQAFVETTLASISDRYDVVQLRVGTQPFNSDFRGFLFLDDAPGVRLFGNVDDNRWQWNLAAFERLNKDTNSGLNTFDRIGQRVFVANLYRQDVLSMLTSRSEETTWNRGLTSQLSFQRVEVDSSVHYDQNGFLVRPRLIGTVQPSDQAVNWIGWTNDGHVGRVNVESALYVARGTSDFDEIAGRRQDVRAGLGALELSYDMDWMRFRVQGLYQSGDDDPEDDRAGGFDAIFDNENFAGGEFSFWNRNAIPLTGTGVGLVQAGSLYNTLRSSKNEGNPSFVNPGLLLGGVGFDAQVTPHLKIVTNASFLRFADTSSLEYVLGQDSIGRNIGTDLSIGVIWRPLLTENVIVKSGVSSLIPAGGFRDIYQSDTLYAFFGELILTW